MSTRRSSLAKLIRLTAILVLLLAALVPLQAGAQGPVGGGSANKGGNGTPPPVVDPGPVGGGDEAPASEPAKQFNGVYVVKMRQQPVMSHFADIAGGDVQSLDLGSADVQAYASSLEGLHNALVQGVGGEKLYSFRYTFNGFAARLNPAQAAQLASSPDVVAVAKDELLKLDTVTTPGFLGLDQPRGIWEQLGGPEHAGDGVVVGIVDSGIWPESASFADDGSYAPIPHPFWRGECVEGEEWDATTCNNKIIGARYYLSGFGDADTIKDLFPYEYISPRDADGHGSHTSSTAAGNYGVTASAEGSVLGTASGMAPRARIAMYKVCWGRAEAEAGCWSSDSMAAIEQAAMDGVDVINFSISGSRTSISDMVESAFLEASNRGVFVAASAANTGPGASTVQHNSPWITTVAAGSHDRFSVSSVTLGDGSVYNGASLSSGTGVLPLVRSTTAGLPGADATQVRLCYPGTLDPAIVTGKMVMCDRGVIALVDKSLAVKQAGGLGMILANVNNNTLNDLLHSVPTIHVQVTDRDAIINYITTAGAAATAQIAPGEVVAIEAPYVASFSGRGPALALGGDLLKPDIMAPGVNVIAAVSPDNGGRDFDVYSGTSMSSPHIAGIAALLKDRHPFWTPAMIKSAIITTADQVTNAGNPLTGTPFDYGAGQVNPTAAADPGLVYNAGFVDYETLLCRLGLSDSKLCQLVKNPYLGFLFPKDLNLPSIAIGNMAGGQTVVRRVMNVGSRPAIYSASVSGLAGIDVKVEPSFLALQPGQSRSFKITFTRTTATLGSYAFGALTWSDGKHAVRSPIAIKPVALAAPAEVAGAGTDGSTSYDVKFGFDGPFAAVPHGLVAATTFEDTVAEGDYVLFDVEIPAGTLLARFSLFDEYTSGADDLDLYVFLGNTQVGGSGSATSAEQVNLSKPVAGTYTVLVDGFATEADTSDFTLFTWAVGEADAGNLTVTAPDTAVVAQTAAVTLDWAGLDAGTKYLGIVSYHNVAAPAGYDDGRVGATIVGVSTD